MQEFGGCYKKSCKLGVMGFVLSALECWVYSTADRGI